MDERVGGSLWPEEWTRRIGRNLAALRALKGVSGRELSERCEALGHPMPRNLIANLESGRKTTIPVHEVVILAQALGVPPIRLLYDVSGEEERVEVLPGLTAPAWSALQWFTGEQPLHLGYRWSPFSGLPPSREDREAWETGAEPLTWHRIHDERAAAVVAQRVAYSSALDAAGKTPNGPAREAADRAVDRGLMELRRAQYELQRWRERMTARGVIPAAVDPELLPPAEDPEADEFRQRIRAEFDRRLRFLQEDGDA